MEDEQQEKKIQELKSRIKCYPNFPKDGILFWDIFSAISDGSTCKLLLDLVIDVMHKKFPEAEAVVGMESRGFLFSFPLAAKLGIGCVPVRKKGKLPGPVISLEYALEYASDSLEVQSEAFSVSRKCVLVDDLIATGGTLSTAVRLLRQCGAEVIGCLAVMEIVSLNGRSTIPDDVPVHSLIKYD